MRARFPGRFIRQGLLVTSKTSVWYNKSMRLPKNYEGKWEQSGDCLLWNASKDANGYGRVKDLETGKIKRTHRLSYEWNHGPIPEGLYVLHKCDTPSCFNPDHLFVGTQQDNIADWVSKGSKRRRKDNCKRGHARTPDNLTTAGNCILCAKERQSSLAYKEWRKGYDAKRTAV